MNTFTNMLRNEHFETLLFTLTLRHKSKVPTLVFVRVWAEAALVAAGNVLTFDAAACLET